MLCFRFSSSGPPGVRSSLSSRDYACRFATPRHYTCSITSQHYVCHHGSPLIAEEDRRGPNNNVITLFCLILPLLLRHYSLISPPNTTYHGTATIHPDQPVYPHSTRTSADPIFAIAIYADAIRAAVP